MSLFDINEDFTGKMLVATPTSGLGEYFEKRVIYIIRHDQAGAVGLIINQSLPKAYNDLHIKHNSNNISLKNINIHAGGPVGMEKGFILHLDKSEREVDGSHAIRLSSDMDLLKTLITGKDVAHSIFIFGYCTWDKNQLESEIKKNHWLIMAPDENIIFETKNKQKWNKAMKSLNVPPIGFMPTIGNC